MLVPFKTPVDYFDEVLKGDAENINKFKELMEGMAGWEKYDCDLHIYPYTHAVPAVLSMGCRNRCFFCPTFKRHGGVIHFGDPEEIIPKYEGATVHFMDEDFFNNDLDKILPLLEKYHVTWLAMSHAGKAVEALEKYGEDRLWKSGLRIIEVGLENVALMMKVKKPLAYKKVEIYYLNMTCLPKETKETIQENAEWMKERSLKRPIHFNNSLWYACGQFYYPYEEERVDGIFLETEIARTRPTFVPTSLLAQDFRIENLERANYYSQLAYDIKMFPKENGGNIGEFIGKDMKKALWMLSGIRSGGIV